MSGYTITPWRFPTDLLEVRQQLYQLEPNGSDQRRHAVNRVLAWKLRGGNLPHAVESTALLVDAALHQTSDVSMYSIRAVYTAAFTRFVTGFCDIGRARERVLEPSSMLEIARQIGMPPDFVALRHEATHQELPGLRRLVNASNQALAWLWQVYWSKLEFPTETTEAEEVALRDTIRRHLKDFRRSQLEALKGKRTKAPPSEAALKYGLECLKMCEDNVNAMEAYSPVKLRVLVETLVSERFLMPSKRELVSLPTSATDTLETDSCRLASSMDGAFLLWDDLLNVFITRCDTFLYSLVTQLLVSLEAATTVALKPEHDTECEGHMLWILHCVRLAEGRPAEPLRAQIVKHCCLHSGHWQFQMGKAVITEAPGDFADQWEGLLEATRPHGTENGAVARPGSDQTKKRRDEALIREEVVEHGWKQVVLEPTSPLGRPV